MRKNFRGTAAACAVTILVAALSGCSGLSFDAAQGSGSAPVGEPSSGPKAEQPGRPHDPGAGDNPRSRGADEDAGGKAGNSDGKSSDESAREKRGESVGEGARPAGHEGLWFDSEPQDPWDKYVWKSQKFIGKGGEIPKLGPGTADKNFWGLPDLCSTQMQKKMGEVGFEFSDRGANDAGLRDCYYQESIYDPLSIKSSFVLLSRTTELERFQRIERSIKFKLPRSFYAVRSVIQIPQYQCGMQKIVMERNVLTIVFVDMLQNVDFEDSCRRSGTVAQVISNVTG